MSSIENILEKLKRKFGVVFVCLFALSLSSLIGQFKFVTDLFSWALHELRNINGLYDIISLIANVVHIVVTWWREQLNTLFSILGVSINPLVVDILSTAFFITARAWNLVLPLRKEVQLAQQKITHVEQKISNLEIHKEVNDTQLAHQHALWAGDYEMDDDEELTVAMSEDTNLQYELHAHETRASNLKDQIKRSFRTTLYSLVGLLGFFITMYVIDYVYVQNLL